MVFPVIQALVVFPVIQALVVFPVIQALVVFPVIQAIPAPSVLAVSSVTTVRSLIQQTKQARSLLKLLALTAQHPPSDLVVPVQAQS